MTAEGKVLCERRGHVAVLTLNDPARRNALSRDIVRGLFDALAHSVQSGARAIVITAQGPAFCAGANIDDLRNGWMEGKDPSEDPALLFQRLSEMPCPVIAAIQGLALGGGLELALSCDLVVAAEDAWFALPELGHGVIPNTGLALLQRMVGTRRALEMVLTRRRVAAPEALAMGLVNRVVAGGEVLPHALALAAQVVDHAPPGAIRAAKSNFHGHAAIDWARVLRSPLDVPPSEWQEGLDSFTERRAPSFERFWADDTGARDAQPQPLTAP
ncbi:enoyl-CoA hydratase/isomerase family protein [Variovorax sp. LT1R20]|uniref:enoyl-CoA hydratase/isomerase family protein n=1 Tax=Variovorax sp. LT1R20 TaxID=3443729 RepID=UPI003F45C62E